MYTMCLHRAGLHTKNRLFFYVLVARGVFTSSTWDMAILGLIVLCYSFVITM